MQVDAFKDYSPDEAGASAQSSDSQSDGGKKEQEEASPAPAAGAEAEAEAEESSGGGDGGGASGDYPPHRVEGLPALSPTMSQGEAVLRIASSLDSRKCLQMLICEKCDLLQLRRTCARMKLCKVPQDCSES